MTLFTGLQMPEKENKLAGLLVMSGYLPGASQFKLTEGNYSLTEGIDPLWCIKLNIKG